MAMTQVGTWELVDPASTTPEGTIQAAMLMSEDLFNLALDSGAIHHMGKALYDFVNEQLPAHIELRDNANPAFFTDETASKQSVMADIHDAIAEADPSFNIELIIRRWDPEDCWYELHVTDQSIIDFLTDPVGDLRGNGYRTRQEDGIVLFRGDAIQYLRNNRSPDDDMYIEVKVRGGYVMRIAGIGRPLTQRPMY